MSEVIASADPQSYTPGVIAMGIGLLLVMGYFNPNNQIVNPYGQMFFCLFGLVMIAFSVFAFCVQLKYNCLSASEKRKLAIKQFRDKLRSEFKAKQEAERLAKREEKTIARIKQEVAEEFE